MAATRSSEAVARLEELLAIPSVSLDPARAGDMRRAADWLADELHWAGGRVVETDGHPIVLAEWLGPAGRRANLLYGPHQRAPPRGAGGRDGPAFLAPT